MENRRLASRVKLSTSAYRLIVPPPVRQSARSAVWEYCSGTIRIWPETPSPARAQMRPMSASDVRSRSVSSMIRSISLPPLASSTPAQRGLRVHRRLLSHYSINERIKKRALSCPFSLLLPRAERRVLRLLQKRRQLSGKRGADLRKPAASAYQRVDAALF